LIAFFKIALRNVFKNQRRSFFTALAVSLGFTAVNLFAGFAEYIYVSTRETAIYARCNGHLMVFKEGFLDKGKIDPGKYLISKESLETIKELCHEMPEVDLIAPHLMITGLVTNGRVSTIFVAQGIKPSSVHAFLDRPDKEKTLVRTEIGEDEGKELQDDKIYGVAMAKGLAQLLSLNLGSYAVAFTNTIDGQMNALDMEVFQFFEADMDVLNDMVMRVPLEFAQNLYGTESVDRVAILLRETKETLSARKKLQSLLAKQLPGYEVKTWVEMSDWYRKVKRMFDVIFAFLFVIVLVIVTTSVVNTMGMAVIERTREIGTLRALGLKRRGVMTLFTIESFLLGFFGTLGGLILTLFGSWVVDMIRPTWIPPGITSRVPITVFLSWKQMIISFGCLIFLCLLASLVPARRAAKQNVVKALGHV
jgi:putative ABC transport system permease protein